jgi:hypothetical protein
VVTQFFIHEQIIAEAVIEMDTGDVVESRGASKKKGAANQHKVVQPLEKSQTRQPACSKAGKSLA